MEPKLIEEITTIIRDTRDFVVEQAPSLVQEFLSWRIKYLVTCIGLLLLGCAGLGLVMRRIWRVTGTWTDPYDDRGAVRVVAGATCVIVGAGLLAGLVDCGLTLLQALTAPRVYLLEQFTKLVH